MNTIADALVDVRKAHRLVCTFNRRVFEMAEIISEALPGFRFESMTPHYEGYDKDWKPGDEVESFWNSTPGIHMQMAWSNRAGTETASAGEQVFGLVLSVDTEWEKNDDDIDPATYKVSAENSRTELSFYLLSFETTVTTAEMLQIWEDFDPNKDMVIVKAKRGKAVGVRKTIDMATIEYLQDTAHLVNQFMSASKTMILSV